MSRVQFWLAVAFAVVLCTGGGFADDKKEPQADARKSKRVVYLARNLPPADLAKALTQHFKGDVEAVTVSEKTSNALLISATPEAFAAVLETLEQIDGKAHAVAVEVIIAEVTAGKDGLKAIDERDLSGPADKVMERIRSLKKDGTLGSLKSVQLGAVDNQRVNARVGESKPFVVGMNVTRVGIAQNTIQYRDMGMTVAVKPRVGMDGQLAIEVEVEESRMNTPESGVALGTTDKGTINAAEFIQASLRSTVKVASGHAVLAQGVKTESKSQNAQTLIIVTARILDGAKK